MANKTALPDTLPTDLSRVPPEQLIPINAARKWLRGKGGKSPHPASLRRWASPSRGYRVNGEGARLLLPAVKIGGEFYTTEEACRWFEAARIRMGARQAVAV